ncbi:MAG: WD40 repeat domain-containing protein [Planctomycetaceae bacterium]|nr:WD40 repeat domain-containing protein [Planctomycetaceae bacterium]
MYRIALLAILTAWIPQIQAQTVLEPTKIVRLHGEIGKNGPIPIVKSLDLAQQGHLLALGGDDHIIRLWNVRERKFVAQLHEHKEAVRGLAFSPDDSRLVTVAQDGQIHIWDTQDGRRLHSIPEPVRGMRRIMFQPNSSRFAVCGFDQNVRIYDAVTYQLIATFPAHGTNNEAVAYSHDGSLLAVGGRTGIVRIWNTADYRHLTDIAGDGRRVRAMAFSPDDSLLATGGEGPFIMLWNPQDGALVRVFSERPGKTFSLTFCGSDVLASGESDNMARLWDPSTGEQTAILSGHTGTVSTMRYVSRIQMLVTGSFDASIRFWTLAQPSLLQATAPTVLALPAAPPEWTEPLVFPPGVSALVSENPILYGVPIGDAN